MVLWLNLMEIHVQMSSLIWSSMQPLVKMANERKKDGY